MHQKVNTKFRSQWSNEMPRQLSKFDTDVWVEGGRHRPPQTSSYLERQAVLFSEITTGT